ncbi:uncharacterized protein MKS88_000219 [Plasmodium brasilianum]|uniref:uncharacterized protein n=1 Tax=Plasmodium brasilianum TaxID=5824 RepID=UPI00350E4F74|nr:hypothetical protein MKS88_000219 [Plasmodium brasilianum]
MENCITSHLSVSGYSYFRFFSIDTFKNTTKYLNDITNSLKKETKKEKFREGCKGLAKYLIQHKNPPPYQDKVMWEKILYSWAKSYYSKLDKHGGCLVIVDEKDLALLNLKYEVEDFCEEKESRIRGIPCYKNERINIKDCNEVCASKINEYNTWINGRKSYFNSKKDTIISKCNNQPSHFPSRQCNILGSSIFKTLSECKIKRVDSQLPSAHKEEKKDVQAETQNTFNIPSTGKVSTQEIVKSSQEDQIQTEKYTTHDQEIRQEPQSQTNLQLSTEPLSTAKKVTRIQDVSTGLDSNSITLLQPENEGLLQSTSIILQNKDSYVSLAPHSPENSPLTAEASVSSSVPVEYSGPFKILGILKKNKNLRRQVKFLRLLIPSFSNNNSKHFTDDHFENPIYDDEEIIKKIKINELTKNVNSSKQQKDRSKTIIEVHMQVLEECRNEDWENKKEEFLKICLDEFKKKDYRTYPNLTYNDLITENIKSSNDIEKQNILWNKWVETHRYLFAKLKKEDWYNNLKNEWKKELAYIQEIDKLKKKSSNENRKIPFLEIEKDLWKQWISKNCNIIEQYLEQEWLKVLTEKLQSISEECVSEETINYISLINIEELQNKENYKELYKYIKKKLLTKLCILVLMSILEECTKEVNFNNRESYFDSSINEWKAEVYSDNKQEITENIIEYNNNDIENKRNKELHAHIGNENFRNEIEDWTRENDIYANSIVNDGTIKKSHDIAQRHTS